MPRPHPLRSECLSTLARAQSTRYRFSGGSEDLDKSVYHTVEAILLPFHIPIELGSYLIETLFYLATGLLLRSCKLKKPDDVKHTIRYLRYLQDQSLETSDVTRNEIEVFLVQALAVQVKLGSVDPMRDIGEMATLCHELLRSGVKESLLYGTVKAFAIATSGTNLPFGQPPSDGAIECLRKARIRLPNLEEELCFALLSSLSDRFYWAHSDDDYEEAMSILDEMIADPNGNVKQAMERAGMLAQSRFSIHSKPEHLAEAIFRTRTYLNAMSSEDPNRRSVMKQLADLEKTRFDELGVRSGRQEDKVGCAICSHSVVTKRGNPV